MRLVSSFAILRVKIVVVRIRTIVPKRRDESPHILSLRDFFPSKVSFKNQQSTNAKKKRQRRRENTNFVRTKVSTYVERKQNNREIEKNVMKKVLTLILHISSTPCDLMKRKRNEEEKEKKELSESEREPKKNI